MMRKLFLSSFLLILLWNFSYAQELSNTEKQLVDLIDKNYSETVALLEETVNINSGTLNLEGVREVGRVFEREFAKIGFKTEWIQLPDSLKRAGHFVASRSGNKGKNCFLSGIWIPFLRKTCPSIRLPW
jgi:glutamate carboxypeptidase